MYAVSDVHRSNETAIIVIQIASKINVITGFIQIVLCASVDIHFTHSYVQVHI